MKPFNLKRIIGMTTGLTALVLLGGGAQLYAQTIAIKYPSRPPANGAFACAGDTIEVTATAADIDDLVLPKGARWSGDADNAVVAQSPNSITKRFFTYHPYSETEPTLQKSQEFEFTIRLKNNTETKVKQTIVAKSCPPRQLKAPARAVTSFGDKYNLGNISFDLVFDNETSEEGRIQILPTFDPPQPFKLLTSSRTTKENQLNLSYRAIQISDATYDIAIRYNEGDSIRNIILPFGFIALTQELDTLRPDATAYCPGNDIVFSLELGTNWQNVMNQTINNDESKIGACFDWSGSPAPVSFTRREDNKYFFSTQAAGTSTGDYRCTMSVNLKYANAKNSPKIDTSFTVKYDVPVKNVQYAQAKGFKQHDTTVCQERSIDLLDKLETGATLTQFRTKSGVPITQFANYKPTQSDVVYADISSPCPWTDTLRVNVIAGDEFLSVSPIDTTLLICAGDSVSFSVAANSSPIGWTILVPTNTDANESWNDTENGLVHKRAFYNNAFVTATLSQCVTKYQRYEIQVVQRPQVTMDAEVAGCPYTMVNLSGTGGNNPQYRLYDLRSKTDVTAAMGAYLKNTGLTDYPLRPNDSLRLIYTAGNSGSASGFTPASLTCTASDTAQIIAYATPSLRIRYQGTDYTDGETACVPREQSFTLTASGADTYKWLDNQILTDAARSLTLAKDSLIRVRGENTLHCFDTIAVNCVVSVEKAGRVQSAADCPGTEICFEAKELPETTYAWYDPDDKPLDVTSPKLCRVFQAGQEGVYTLRTQRSGCAESLPYTLTLYPAPNIEGIGNSPLCVGEELVINYKTGLPDEGLQVTFTKDGESKSNEIEHLNGDMLRYRVPDVQPSDAGRYILTVTTTEHQCKDSDTYDFSVEEPAVVRIVLASDTVCEDDQTRLRADIRPPSDSYIYEWYNDYRTIYDADQNEIEVRWMREDNGPLHLRVHQHACESHADTVIVVIPKPHLSGMPQDTGICQGESFCLSPVSDIEPEEFRWFWIYSENAFRTLPQQSSLPYCLENAEESMNGGYFVLVTHTVGSARCVTWSDTTQLTVHQRPDIRIAGPDYICDQSTVMLRAISNTAGTVRWHHNNSTEDIIHVSDPGRYAVTRISEYGCQDSADHYLVARALPYFSLPPDTSICRGSWTMIYGPDDMDAYLWNDGSQDKDHIVEAAGLYTLTVARNGCSYSDSIKISMTFCGQFHFPTAFTPNDNRVNDTWGAISSAKDEDMAEFDLIVFDRNGKKVFHGKRISEQWDGRYKGQLCPPGVYMYSFKALEKLEGIKYQGNGTVTIIQ